MPGSRSDGWKGPAGRRLGLDFLRGRETADYDIEVYGIEATALRGLLDRLGQVNAVGEAFTVYKVRLREGGSRFIVDVSLPRRESKIGRGSQRFCGHRRPDHEL
ncbi:MAG: hypothetical protein IPJ07_23265 [Acidobacteria bacterium]|nr:hypothetical protein [Acidobacteriota bacterium]